MKNKMKITTKESAIRAILREVLATSSEMISGGHDESQQTTVPSRLPINPSDQAATQLSQQRPPVEDPEFIPASQEELGKAMDALASLVPDDKVEKFYRQIVAMIDKTVEEDAAEKVKAGG